MELVNDLFITQFTLGMGIGVVLMIVAQLLFYKVRDKLDYRRYKRDNILALRGIEAMARRVK